MNYLLTSFEFFKKINLAILVLIIVASCVKGEYIKNIKIQLNGELLHCECEFFNNERHGENKCLDSRGNVILIEHYASDTLDGLQQYFFPNGQTQTIGWYVKGRREGIWVENNEDGTLKKYFYFKNGSPIYLKQFNSRGIFQGGYLPMSVIPVDSSVARVGEEYELKIFLEHYFDMNGVVTQVIAAVDLDGNGIDIEIQDTLINKEYLIFSFTPRKSGENTIYIELAEITQQNTIFGQDSLYYKFKVYPKDDE